ncbi:unnamed protein product [Echinostoma caproni]|uniref:C2H2-type domain-containing protein n=1 Tax=Echinostoma caproni TaxID=27848 RepID=A0A183AAI9_9TREM|nr:unnamed protein product [Echinostoma caproni]
MASVLGSFSIERIISASRPETPIPSSSPDDPSGSTDLISSSSPIQLASIDYLTTRGQPATVQSGESTQYINADPLDPSFPDVRPTQSAGLSLEDDSGSGKLYTCPHCGKVFTAHYNLTRHMPIHTGARPFVCKVSD